MKPVIESGNESAVAMPQRTTRTYYWPDIVRYINRAAKGNMTPKERETFKTKAVNAWAAICYHLTPEQRLRFIEKVERVFKSHKWPMPLWNPAPSPDGDLLLPNIGPMQKRIAELKEQAAKLYNPKDPTRTEQEQLRDNLKLLWLKLAREVDDTRDAGAVSLKISVEVATDYGSHANWKVTYPDNSTAVIAVDNGTDAEARVRKIAARNWVLMSRIKKDEKGVASIRNTGVAVEAVAKLIAETGDSEALTKYPMLDATDIEAVKFHSEG